VDFSRFVAALFILLVELSWMLGVDGHLRAAVAFHLLESK
jgi:hypothetical protein